MKGSTDKVYKVEGIDGYHTIDECRAIDRAIARAVETGLSINIYLNGVNVSYVKPNGLVVDRSIKKETVADKYFDLKRFNNADFKRLSFR